jgi:N,N-dimethylformamidase beta subunit-like, C-terminal/Domain of unknown function (DUF4082)/Fibronectin type III domain
MNPASSPRTPAVLLALIAALVVLGAAPAVSQAAPCTPPVVNQVACENTQAGSPQSSWEVEGAGDSSIQGYATAMSVNKGQTISFKIKSSTSNYHIDILRLGYYQNGDGARLIASNLTPTGTSTQPACQTFSTTGLIDCGNWSVSRSWTVPSTAVSGVYIAHLVRNDTGGDSQIVFVVRDDSSHSDILVQTSDATWQAYNTYGGNSLYQCTVACPPGEPAAYKGAYKVSYNRPFHTAEDDGGRSWLFTGAEYPMIRFLERNGYDVSYTSSADVGRNPALLKNHKVFISSGHDEYWSASQRSAVEAARDAGVSLAFFTGNEMFWKTRWEPSADGTNTQDRTLVSYKDTHFTERQDPVEWTGTWRDPRFTTPSENVTPENAVTGQSFLVNTGTSRITVPFAYKNLRLWRNTAATSLTSGQSLQLAPNTLGYEWDQDADNGFRPNGEFKLSATTVSGLEVFTDYGSTTALNGTATHNLTMYKAPSGARVFGAGTVQWAWGLDDWNPDSNAADRNMEQATVNLFADMGAQPATMQSDLTGASASTDTTAPTSTLSVPSAVNDGQNVTISGTASDTGGQVAGVEVSTDGGTTWHPATGTTSWTYAWIAHGNPSTVVKVRAVDDSGNLQTPGAGTTVTVNCPCSLWGTSTQVPSADVDSGDPTPGEVGVKFKADSFGAVTGLRFYKAATNTGTHIGSLWSTDGTRLAQATFTGETGSGWQTVTFATPVQVTPGTTYIASYYAPNGHYSATANYLYRNPAPGPNGGGTADAPPLHAIRNTGTETNGVYTYSASSSFPVNSFGAANYWVDVVFSPTPAPGQVTNVSAVAGGKTSANVTWSAPASGGAVTSYKITPYVGSTAQTPTTINGSPPATAATITGLTTGTTYTFTVQAINPTGSGPVSAQSNSVTPLTAVAPSAPTGVAAQGASSQAKVTWTTPQADGDSPITGYTVTPYIGATAQTPVSADASATSATVSGLTNGTVYTFKVTATNAVGTSPASAASNAVTPQATIFDFATPATVDSGDTTSVELGVKFKADYNGSITGVRFYKASTNIGVHIGSLWSSTGTRLAQATFANESASGWQTVTFASPVSVTAGTTYVASYFAPSGHYSHTNSGLSTAVDNPPLHALADSTSSNGVYAYSTTSTFPSNTYSAANYWVDVLYAVPAPGQVTGVTAAEAGQHSADVSWTAPATGGPVTSYKITPYIGSTAQTATTITGTPPATSKTITGLTSGTTYTFTVQALNANGAGPASTQSNTVTPSAPVVPSAPIGVTARPATTSALVSWSPPNSDGDSAITGYTVTPYIGSAAQTAVQVSGSTTSKTMTGLTTGTAYTFKVTATNGVGAGPASTASSAVTPQDTILDFATPTTADAGDLNPVEVGVKFKTDFGGSVTGIRFYKASTNTGTHIGSLWSSTGTRLAQATFTNETASGWQHVTFASPVTITAGTTYVASYFAPSGHYSVTGGGFSSAVDNAPLHAIADSVSANGLYAYTSASAFPSSSFGASNYGVDVLFQPAGAPGQVTGVTATAGQASAGVSWTAPATGGPPTSYDITPYIGSAAQTPTTVTGTPPATSKTITELTPGTAYTFKVTASNPSGSGAASAASNSVTPTGAGAPAAPTGATAEADTKSALVSWTAPSDDGGSAITGYTVTPFAGTTAGTPVDVGASTTKTRVSGLTNGTAYTFKVTATNGAGTGPASGASNAVTPKASILEFTTPGVADAGDPGSVVLGVKFTADVAGSVTGVRFYKAATNTGTHVGALWSATGQLLAQGTFSGESASGWQTLTFATPVAVTAGTTYVASYLAPSGHYSVTSADFATGPIDNPPLHALADLVSPNGVYAYSATSVFPSSSYNATNYSVDVLFAPGG